MTETVTTAGSGLVFVNTYTAAAQQNAAYINCIVAAEQTLESLFTNSITFNVKFDYAPLAAGTAANNQAQSDVPVSYSQLLSKLPATDMLPANDPTGGHTFTIPEAYARLLGLSTVTPSTDDTVTLSSSPNWTFGQDAISAIMHELTENCMGRVGGLGVQNGDWGTMDLFRFNSSGARDFSDGIDGQPTYFSVDGSNLNLTLSFFNSYHNGTVNTLSDPADFTQQDVFGTNGPGQNTPLSQTDIAIMHALGWNGPHTNPTIAAVDISVPVNLSLPISTNLTVSNPSSDKLTSYWVEDNGGGSGHVTVGGTAEPDGQWFQTSTDWSNVQYVAGSTNGTDQLEVAVFDATTNSFVYSSSFNAETTHAPVVGGITVATIENDFNAITRGTLSADAATAIINEINGGTQTETGYVNSLFTAQVFDTTIPAVAVEGSMYGATGTSAEITMLTTQFLPAQVTFAQQNGLNAQVVATEALGLVFAFGNENQNTNFAANFGPEDVTGAISPSGTMPNSAAGDAAFAAAAASAIYGSASTANLVNVLDTWVTNWKAFYTQNGLPWSSHPTADQIDLAARGAAWGDAVGTALAGNIGPLNGQAINFLDDAAQGSAQYGVSLVGQAAHHSFA